MDKFNKLKSFFDKYKWTRFLDGTAGFFCLSSNPVLRIKMSFQFLIFFPISSIFVTTLALIASSYFRRPKIDWSIKTANARHSTHPFLPSYYPTCFVPEGGETFSSSGHGKLASLAGECEHFYTPENQFFHSFWGQE